MSPSFHPDPTASYERSERFRGVSLAQLLPRDVVVFWDLQPQIPRICLQYKIHLLWVAVNHDLLTPILPPSSPALLLPALVSPPRPSPLSPPSSLTPFWMLLVQSWRLATSSVLVAAAHVLVFLKRRSAIWSGVVTTVDERRQIRGRFVADYR